MTAVANSAKRMPVRFILAVAVTFAGHNAPATPITVSLGTASSYAVLAGSAITSTGPTVLNGGLGLTPGSSVTGGPVVNGVYNVDNAAAVQAQNDLTTAYNQAAGFAPNQNLSGQDLGGLTLTPGVYFFSSSAQLTGTLTLNDMGNPNAQFVFQIGSTLTTASDSSVATINGGNGPSMIGCDVFWQVGSSVTLGTTTVFEGNILALTSITADTGATDLDGRLLAQNGAVTLDNNTITLPNCCSASSVPDNGSTLLMLGFGLASLLAFGRRFPFPA